MKIISCTLFFLMALPAYCWTNNLIKTYCRLANDLIATEENARKNSADLNEMRIELTRSNEELSSLIEQAKKRDELNNWITVNGIQLCFFVVEEHLYLCAVRGQGISMIHAASCPCVKKLNR